MYDDKIPGLPSISQYADSVSNPDGLFRTLGGILPTFDPYGAVQFTAGNNAVVFPVVINGERFALKCYIKPPGYARQIYSYVNALRDPLLVEVRRLPSEIYVYDAFDNGAYYDVILARWAEGITLDRALRRAVRQKDSSTVRSLALSFVSLAREILGREWAHGDLKPENVIVGEDHRMTLIDYDAMWVPELAGMDAVETGTPSYQHPARDSRTFGKETDHYPAALITVSLLAICYDLSLYGKHNRQDNLLLYPWEIPGGDPGVYREVMDLFASRGNRAALELGARLCTDSPTMEGLDQLLPAVEDSLYETAT